MTKNGLLILCASLLSISVQAQPAETQIQTVADHNGWGWTAIVQTNGIITVATVPDAGARIMQMDLFDHPFFYMNPSEIGKTYTPARNGLHSYGGYVLWPGPQARWNWPPPPVLDYGSYSTEILSDTPDSAKVKATSEIEKWQTPDLRFQKIFTIYKGSSRVRVEQTLINEGGSPQDWSVWDVTQTPAGSPNDNYWVYFPINPNSENGPDGVYYRDNRDSDAWQGEVAPGVYGVVFRPEGKKIFSDSHKGWAAYVDEGAGKAYIKTFPIFEDAVYPGDNGGGRVQVYLGGANFEVEVASPIMDLAPNGGQYTFTQNWYSATMNGPVLDVSSAGAVEKSLSINSQTGHLNGTYGVFYQGTGKIVCMDNSGSVIAESEASDVSPAEKWLCDASLDLNGVSEVSVMIYDAQGLEIGPVETVRVDQLTSVAQAGQTPESFDLRPVSPNPFNPSTVIRYHLPKAAQVELTVYDIAGHRIATLVKEKQTAGEHSTVFNGINLASGIYLVRLQAEAALQTQRMLLIK